MIKPLETDRLNLRLYTEKDAAFTLELLNTPSWIQYIGDRNVKTLAEARAYIREKILKAYRDHGLGMYVLELKESGDVIGACGLIKREGLPGVDLGFALHPDYEGNGYGYESASAVLAYAFGELGIDQLLAITVHYNESSIRLLEKLGFTLEGTTRLPGDEEELLLYSVSKK